MQVLRSPISSPFGVIGIVVWENDFPSKFNCVDETGTNTGHCEKINYQ